MFTKVATIAAFAAGALAHGAVAGVTIDGKFQQGFSLDYYYANQNKQPVPDHMGWYAENLDNGFVEPNSFGSADIICHKAGSPKLSSDTMASVAAGDTIEFHWSVWPESHAGPVITYVAPYTGDILAVDKTALKWTKIQADGYNDGKWAAVEMIAQNNTWPVTVPSTLAAGKYVFRHEIIALHSAGALNGAQSYPQCLNIEVTGSGTEKPDGVVGTSLYKADEDGIIFNINNGVTAYPIPGPALWTGGSGSGTPPASAPSATTATGTTQPTTTAAAVTTTAAATTTSAAAATSAVDESTPVASSTPVPSSGAELPETFTLDTFIAWLQKNAGSSSSSKARRHARALF